MDKTGWPPPPLMQDDNPQLSRWFASRPDARYVLKTNQRRKQMKLQEVLKEVEHINNKLDVYVWVDGERYPVTYVDKSFIREGFIEFNVDTGETK